MDKQEQIEEIAKYICNACEMGFDIDGDCAQGNNYKTCGISKETAEYIYNAGYRKIPEDAVVLTGRELADRTGEIWKQAQKQARKETAKEILQVVSKIVFELFGNEPPCNFNCNDEYMFDNCNDYCKKNCEKNVYEKCWKEFFIAKLKANGVEVEEWKI